MTDIQLILFYLSIFAVLAAFVVFLAEHIRRKAPEYSLKGNFSKDGELLFEALKECHFKNASQYLSNIKKLAETYPDEPVFFLFAGDIARRSDPQKALEIHRDVLFRPTTTGKFRSLVLKHIAEDYVALKQNAKALSVLKDALKSANSPAAHLTISKIMESEGNYDEAYVQLEKYISGSDIKERALLKKIAARAVNYFFKNDSDTSSIKWLEIIAKLSNDPNEIKAVEYSVALIKGKQKKAAVYLKALSEAGENYEILGRSLLIKKDSGHEINSAAEGKFTGSFHLLFNPQLKNIEVASIVGNRTAFYGLLLARFTNDPECGSFLKDTISEKTLFICSECGNDIKTISPVCRNCQKITGRKFRILLED
jgi:lipopolysaccharide biosynthesis regulator YciM